MTIDIHPAYEETGLSIDDVNQFIGPVMLEFGANWCGYCQAAQPIIAKALNGYPDIQRIKIEDGKGKRLGRIFKVKLWPTLIFLLNGKEINRLVRPQSEVLITEVLKDLKSKLE